MIEIKPVAAVHHHEGDIIQQHVRRCSEREAEYPLVTMQTVQFPRRRRTEFPAEIPVPGGQATSRFLNGESLARSPSISATVSSISTVSSCGTLT